MLGMGGNVIMQGLQSLQSLSMFLAVLAALWGRTLMTLTRWLLLVVLAVGAHGGLRIASSEGVGTGVPLLAALFNRSRCPPPTTPPPSPTPASGR